MKPILACLTALLILLCSITVHAQQVHTLKGRAAHVAGKKVELLDFYGDKNRPVSSTTVDKNGLFQFQFSDDSSAGMYRLKFEKGRQVDIMYNRKDIELSITRPNVQAGRYSFFDGIDVISSGAQQTLLRFPKDTGPEKKADSTHESAETLVSCF